MRGIPARPPGRRVLIGAAAAVVIAVTGCAPAQSGDLKPPAEPVELQFRVVTEQIPDTGTAAAPQGAPATSDAPATTEPSADSPTDAAELEVVWDKVGTQAARLAQSLRGVVSDSADLSVLEPFAALTPAEVAVLPASVQFYVPTVRCDQLSGRELKAIAAQEEAVSCGEPEDGAPPVKYLLAPADIDSSDVSEAVKAVDPSDPGRFVVHITMTDSGGDKWAELSGANIGQQVAIVIGIDVLSAPVINSRIDGGAIELYGNFTADEAGHLADQIDAGADG